MEFKSLVNITMGSEDAGNQPLRCPVVIVSQEASTPADEENQLTYFAIYILINTFRGASRCEAITELFTYEH